MKNNQYYVVLKENITFDSVVAEKIRKSELKTSEKRFPFTSKTTEVYYSGSKNECKKFILKLDNEIQDLFDAKKQEELH